MLKIKYLFQVLADSNGIKGNNKLFICGDNKSLDLCTFGSDINGTSDVVLGFVNGNAHVFQSAGGSSPGLIIVFADACGEDDGIYAAHSSGISADVLLNIIGEDIEGQLGALVAFFGGIVKVTEVGGNTGNAKDAGLLVENVQDLFNGHVLVLAEEFNDGGVDAAAAGTHGKTIKGGKAHGGVNADALVNCSDGGTVAQMAGNDLAFGYGLAEEIGGLLGNITVGSSVEAVATDAVLGVVLIRDGIDESLGGHLGVESGIKNGYLGNTGHGGFTSGNADEVGGVVEGGQGDALFDILLALFGDENGIGISFTGGDDAVTDSVDLLHGGDNADLGIGEDLGQMLDSIGMGVEGGLSGGLLAIGFILKSSVDADALIKALGHDAFGIHIDQLILQRRTAGVDNKNVHCSCTPILIFLVALYPNICYTILWKKTSLKR